MTDKLTPQEMHPGGLPQGTHPGGGLPTSSDSLVKFTLEVKNDMYTTLETAVFRLTC